MKYILLTLAAGLSACAVSPKSTSVAIAEAPAKISLASQLNGDLHTLHRDTAPYWDIVSFTGFEEMMRKAYDTDIYDGGNYGEIDLNLPDIDFDEFFEFSGFAHVYGHEGKVYITYHSCNGISARYEIEDGSLAYKRYGETMRACERTVIGKSGKRATVYTLMFADDWFASIAPKITGYSVSEDGQSMTLTDENQDVLAEFKYRGEL